jgi:hypothetical protein
MFLYHVCAEFIALAKTNPRARLHLALVGVVALGVVFYGAAALWGLLFPKATRTYAVLGNVSYQGGAVSSGEIIFEPPPGTGQVRTAVISGGTFGLPAREGLPRGRTYVVRVKGFRKTGEKYENADMNLSAEITEQYVPSHYNTESTLRFESTAANLRAGLALDLR